MPRHSPPASALGLAVPILAAWTLAARADPIRPQCWDCIDKLIMQLPADNPNQDPGYEQGLTPGSVLPALTECSLDDSEIPTLQQVIAIFTDASVNQGGAAYVRDHLPEVAKLTAEDRAKLVDGATQDLETTMRHLVDHNCRLLLKSHYDEGAGREWLLHMVALGRGPAVAFQEGSR
ncbi:MAG TPA: hypothetical protein VFL55_21320 [Acetobacteraceae bacterium]|nr:hypothetical protein [Acetobacteraceae bacterium]